MYILSTSGTWIQTLLFFFMINKTTFEGWADEYHEPIVPNATIRLFNAIIHRTPTIMHPSLGNMVALVNYQLA